MNYPKIENLYFRGADGHLLTDLLRVPEFACIEKWEIEEKLDGMNIRIFYDTTTRAWVLRGRTDNAQIPGGLRAWFEAWPKPPAPETVQILYGEAIGPKINGNPHCLPHVQVRIFDVLDVDGEHTWWASRAEVDALAVSLGLRGPGRGSQGIGCISEARDEVLHGVSRVSTNGYFEGIIARPLLELKTQRGQRIIWKLKRKNLI